jgi:hypothetical protein
MPFSLILATARKRLAELIMPASHELIMPAPSLNCFAQEQLKEPPSTALARSNLMKLKLSEKQSARKSLLL